MSASSSSRDRRRAGILGAAGLFAAVLLGLGINGTLASWTTAVITNSNNSVAVVNAVALSESSNADVVCVDTATTMDNTATCSTINKYGGTATPLAPGGSQSTTVKLTNTGTQAGVLKVEGGACSATPAGTGNLCNVMQVSIACPTGTVVFAANNLNAFDAAAASTVSSSLAKGATISCTITVSLPSTAPATVAGQTASQPIVWTLTGA